MKIRSPAKDICDYCTILKRQLETREGKNTTMDANISNSEQWLAINQQLAQHRMEYRQCREFYETTISQATSYSHDTACFSFDYQQRIEIPKPPKQPGQ